MTLKEDLTSASHEFWAMAEHYRKIVDTAGELWREADERCVHLETLPSLKQFIKESHEFWRTCSSLGMAHLDDLDSNDPGDQAYVASIVSKLEEAKQFKAERTAEFRILADKSRAELDAASLNGPNHD